MSQPQRRRLSIWVSAGIVGGLAVVLLVGRGVTGRATGGEGEEAGGGCGGDIDPTEDEIAQHESALTGDSCSSNSTASTGYCGLGVTLHTHCKNEVTQCEGASTEFQRGVQDYEETDYNWRLEPASGASRAVADIGSHWVDTAEYVSGRRVSAVFADFATFMTSRQRPLTESAAFETASGERETVPITSEDAATILLRFDDGSRGAVVISQVSPGRKNAFGFEIDGSRGGVRSQPFTLLQAFRFGAETVGVGEEGGREPAVELFALVIKDSRVRFAHLRGLVEIAPEEVVVAREGFDFNDANAAVVGLAAKGDHVFAINAFLAGVDGNELGLEGGEVERGALPIF